MSDWISNNYENILKWAENISKGDPLAQELAHYAIEKFMQHSRYQEICDKEALEPEYGHSRGFILAIMRNSWFGKKSEFRRVNANHRADIGSRKRNVNDSKFADLLEENKAEEYNYDKDYLIEAIEGLLEEMNLDRESRLWFNARLFEMYLETPNFSEISRKTDIPRTSISNAVTEAKEYIIEELKNRQII